MLLFQLFCRGYREGFFQKRLFHDYREDSVGKEVGELSMCKEKPKGQMMYK